MTSFADRLCEAVKSKRSPLVVGLDPRWEKLPSQLRGSSDCASPADQARAFETFCRDVIDAVAEYTPAVKPQAACFEALGPEGMGALARVIQHARKADLLVLLDGKRNDIGVTAESYAKAYLGRESAWGSDALTVSPYLGEDSLQPFIETAERQDAGVFVLVKTSNHGGHIFQDLTTITENDVHTSTPLYRRVAALVEEFACATKGDSGYGCVGAVVGATYPDQIAELRIAMPSAIILAPGLGAQGGKAADVAAAFDDRGLGCIVNSSRGVIYADDNPQYSAQASKSWQAAVAAAAEYTAAALRAAIPSL